MNDSIFNKITAFFWDIFCLNLVFMASNVVLIGVLLSVVFYWITLPIYLIALFLFILSLKAMLLTIKRFGQVQEVSIVRQYIYAYCEEFKRTCMYAIYYLVSALILGIGYIGISFIIINQSVFIATYLLLLLLLYVHFIFGILIRINFIIDMKGTVRLGLYCISKYPLQCLMILGITWIGVLLIQLIPELLFLGVIPFSGYILIKMTRKVFEEVKGVLNISEEAFVYE